MENEEIRKLVLEKGNGLKIGSCDNIRTDDEDSIVTLHTCRIGSQDFDVDVVTVDKESGQRTEKGKLVIRDGQITE